MLSVRE